MKRQPQYIIGPCTHCGRENWTRKVPYSLRTQEEYGNDPIHVKGLPIGYEPMEAGCGSSIHEAVKEAIAYCQNYNVIGVGFEFNDKTVLVGPTSDAAAVVDAWWKERYNESQAESFAKR